MVFAQRMVLEMLFVPFFQPLWLKGQDFQALLSFMAFNCLAVPATKAGRGHIGKGPNLEVLTTPFEHLLPVCVYRRLVTSSSKVVKSNGPENGRKLADLHPACASLFHIKTLSQHSFCLAAKKMSLLGNSSSVYLALAPL